MLLQLRQILVLFLKTIVCVVKLVLQTFGLNFSDNENFSAINLYSSVVNKYRSFKHVENTHWPTRFRYQLLVLFLYILRSHLTNYPVGFYAYIWSRSIASHIWFKHFAKNPLSISVGTDFRNSILSQGNCLDTESMLEKYLGEKPNYSCFIEHEFATNVDIKAM